MSDNRPPRYVETDSAGNETVVFRASSLGACTRSLVASARAYERRPHPQWFQDVLDEGTGAEDAILAMYAAKYDVQVIGGQAEVTLEIGEVEDRRIIVRGHIDGQSFPGDGLVEAKKFRPSTWPKFLSQGVECNVNYPWQVSVYMHGGGFDTCDFIGGEFVEGEIVSVERKVLASPPIPLKAIRKKVLMVEGKIAAGFDPGDMDCDVRMYPCPYWYLPGHSKDEAGAVSTELEPDDAFHIAIAEYNEASVRAGVAGAASKAADAERKRAAEAIKTWLRAHGVENANATVGGFNVAWFVTPVAAHERKASTRETFTIKEGSSWAAAITAPSTEPATAGRASASSRADNAGR